MSLDRAELAGTGFALAFHVALIAALSLSLAEVDSPAEPPAMEVELVDDVALTAAAPQAVAPPPPSEAPEIGEAEPIAPAPAPAIEPAPAPPQIVPPPPRPQPAERPAPPAKRVPPKPAPARPAKAKAAPAKAAPARATPARPSTARAAPRVSRIGDDFLKGIAADAPAPRAAAATFNAAAKADVALAIARQIRPCALRQRALGEGANRIRVKLSIRLTPTGRLKGPPTITGTSGVDEENAQYEELVKDQAIASYRECAPLRLPAELYQTPTGGWANIVMNYKVP